MAGAKTARLEGGSRLWRNAPDWKVVTKEVIHSTP